LSNHTGYRSIDATPLGDAARVSSGEAITFGGNGAVGRSGGIGTLGFFGRDLGSSAPTMGRVPAFLGLAERTGGTYLERTGDDAPTVGEALRRTGLDFEVRKDALYFAPSGDVLGTGEDGSPAMVREETGERVPMPPRWVATVGYPNDGGAPFPIAPCSPKYTVIQTEEALAAGDALSEGRLVALGQWADRARVYAAWELGEGVTIGGGDPYRNFVTIVTTHDGNGTYGVLAPIRLGCTNQTGATFGRKATPRFTVRHVGEAKFKLEEARRILGLSHVYIAALAEASEGLLATPMTKDRFVVFAREVWAVPAEEELTKQSKAIVAVREEKLLEVLASETCAFGAGTAYAAYNAITEYMDHFANVRGGDDDATRVARRQERIMAGELDRAKTRAFELAVALA
jgi:phage/plasmid-like protein (TIGR03299 family)